MNKNHTFLMLVAACVLDPATVYRKMVKVDSRAPINPAVLLNLQQNRPYSNNHRPTKRMRPESMGSPVRKQYLVQKTGEYL